MTRAMTQPAPHLAPSTSTRRGLPGWWHVANAQRQLAAARRAVPSVLTTVTEGVPGSTDWTASAGEWTGTGTAVFYLGREAPEAVLRMSTIGQHRLRRETAVLTHLVGVPLPAPVRAILPRPLANGTVEGFEYVVQAALSGLSADLLAGQPIWPQLEAAAVSSIDAIHRATARPMVIDEELLRCWVDEPLAVLRRVTARMPGVTRPTRLTRLREILRTELGGRPVLASWIHGDFWAGNLLADAAGNVTGIVDWDLAAADELPSHDHLHLQLYRRHTLTGEELGAIVCELIDPSHAWTDEESAALAACSWAFPEGLPSMRALVLLYWLRHVAAISVQQRSYVTHSIRVWELRNVHRVLRCL
jgi:aminoglycoside phosphotransferase (APT) family kinase protein